MATELPWRTGRKNGRTLYLQTGPEPSDKDDRCIGLLDSPALALMAVRGVNETQARKQRAEALTTRELLNELRTRGDVAMTTFPSTDKGADGAILSALAAAGMRALSDETLEDPL